MKGSKIRPWHAQMAWRSRGPELRAGGPIFWTGWPKAQLVRPGRHDYNMSGQSGAMKGPRAFIGLPRGPGEPGDKSLELGAQIKGPERHSAAMMLMNSTNEFFHKLGLNPGTSAEEDTIPLSCRAHQNTLAIITPTFLC